MKPFSKAFRQNSRLRFFIFQSVAGFAMTLMCGTNECSFDCRISSFNLHITQMNYLCSSGIFSSSSSPRAHEQNWDFKWVNELEKTINFSLRNPIQCFDKWSIPNCNLVPRALRRKSPINGMEKPIVEYKETEIQPFFGINQRVCTLLHDGNALGKRLEKIS